MNELTTTRSNPLVDPSLHVWHGEVAVYLFLGGLVAGIMVLAGLWLLGRPVHRSSRHLSLLPWAAPVLISVGMFFLWLDLENPWNAFRFYLVFRPFSPMSWGAWILLAIYPASILLAWSTTPTAVRDRLIGSVMERSEAWGRRLVSLTARVLEARRGVAVANVVAGAALGVYTGVLLGTMAARPLWNSAILGPLFLVSGLSTGAAFMLLHRLDDEERRMLGRVDMGFIVVELILIAIWLVGLTTGGASSRAAAGTVLGGPYTAAFWTLVITLGLVVPLVAEWLEDRHGIVPGRVAAVLVILGGFALRWILVYAGQHVGWATEVALGGGFLP
ncbi:MAG: polysulfide reductase NrfD [Gemmatimonadota bacterium]|jgi:formate-dependent nitrite reductase membrane component NrfD